MTMEEYVTIPIHIWREGIISDYAKYNVKESWIYSPLSNAGHISHPLGTLAGHS